MFNKFFFGFRKSIIKRLEEIAKELGIKEEEVETLYEVSHNTCKVEKHKVDGKLKVIRKKISDFFEEYEEKKAAILAAKEAGYKYTEIARYLGVNQGYINKILKSKGKISTYTINGYWLDIGLKNDFKKANKEYYEVFDER